MPQRRCATGKAHVGSCIRHRKAGLVQRRCHAHGLAWHLIEQACRLQNKKWPQPFALSEAGIAHGRPQAVAAVRALLSGALDGMRGQVLNVTHGALA